MTALISRAAVTLGLAASFGACHGQNVITADTATGQPTVRRDDSGFSACGVRVVAGIFMGNNAEMYDFSVNFDAGIYRGTMKGGKYTMTRRANSEWDISKRKVAMPSPTSFWIAEQSDESQLKAERFGKSDSAGFSLGLADPSKTAAVVYALAVGKPMQFALRYPSDKMDRIVSIKTEMSKSDTDTVFDCMAGLERRMQREVSAESKR